MGAALTYARRYALFTLVGIAGEDDLDAPDLCDGSRSPATSPEPWDGQPRMVPHKPGNGQSCRGSERPRTLDPEPSAALRDNLLTALGNITSADSAAIWAQEALTAKNRLAASDAKLVEEAFEHRLLELTPITYLFVDGIAERLRPGASQTKPGPTKKCWRPCWPAAPRADIPSRAGHGSRTEPRASAP